MYQNKLRQMRSVTIILSVLVLLVIAYASALALNSYLKTWADTYPDSTSGAADCGLCHGTSTSNLNAYGKDLCEAFDGTIPADITDTLHEIETLDSDGSGGDNLAEIEAGSQPGWKAGAVNQIYDADGCAALGAPIEPPAGIPLPYDPPVYGDPVAIPGGPYTGNVGVPVQFDGSASYDSDGGDLAYYAWDFGDGTTGSGMTPKHTYFVDGVFAVTLTVIDDEGDSSSGSTTASISAEPVLDLDIAGFKVSRTGRVGKSITIELAVDNGDVVLGQAFATVVGAQNGGEVYHWRLNVYDNKAKGTTSFDFPPYTPEAAGTIEWTVTIADVNPDLDEATATTFVK